MRYGYAVFAILLSLVCALALSVGDVVGGVIIGAAALLASLGYSWKGWDTTESPPR